jgi:hypothetical protein
MVIKQVIASAIQKADKSYFYEDYIEQALQVLVMLKKEGLQVVPLQANEEMVKAGVEAIAYGMSDPEEVVKAIYEAMVRNFKG